VVVVVTYWKIFCLVWFNGFLSLAAWLFFVIPAAYTGFSESKPVFIFAAAAMILAVPILVWAQTTAESPSK
jgi:hypothetical protein